MRILLSTFLVLAVKIWVAFRWGPRSSVLLDGNDEPVYLAVARSFWLCGTRDFVTCAPGAPSVPQPYLMEYLHGDAVHLVFGWLLSVTGLSPSILALVADLICVAAGLRIVEILFLRLGLSSRSVMLVAPIVLFLPLHEVLSPAESGENGLISWGSVVYPPTVLVGTRTQFGLLAFFLGQILLVARVERSRLEPWWGAVFGVLCGILAYLSPFACFVLTAHIVVWIALNCARKTFSIGEVGLFGTFAAFAGVATTLPILASMFASKGIASPQVYEVRKVGAAIPLEETLLWLSIALGCRRIARPLLFHWATSLLLLDLITLNIQTVFGLSIEGWHVPIQFVMPLLLGCFVGISFELLSRARRTFMDAAAAVVVAVVLARYPMQAALGDLRAEAERGELFEFVAHETPSTSVVMIQPQQPGAPVTPSEWTRLRFLPVDISLFGERRVTHQLVFEYAQPSNREVYARFERVQSYLFGGEFDVPLARIEREWCESAFAHHPVFFGVRACRALGEFRASIEPEVARCDLLASTEISMLIRQRPFRFTPPDPVSSALTKLWTSSGETWEAYAVDWKRILEEERCKSPSR